MQIITYYELNPRYLFHQNKLPMYCIRLCLFCLFKKQSVNHISFDSNFCFFNITAFQKRETRRDERIEGCAVILFSFSLFFFLGGGLSSRIHFGNQFIAYLWTEGQIDGFSGEWIKRASSQHHKKTVWIRSVIIY